MTKVTCKLKWSSYIYEHYVSSPCRTNDACAITLDTLQISCCTAPHESLVSSLFAFSTASSIPGKHFDP
ncbi:hypothetical protein HanIR_Chr12g0612281 [Helianthus annuus]|nr:hypothetical protein HanIR_Chr12g0612281 [Helianthus annuus]